MTDPDAGPLLLEFGALLDGLPDILQVLDLNGRILYTSPSCKAIAGYEPDELVGQLLVDFIHPDDKAIFFKEYNESVKSSTLLRFSYRFRKADGRWIIFELQGHLHSGQEAKTGLLHHDVDSSEFLLVARPYQTKATALFDSFLELKIENERLLRKIAELKHEAREDRAAQNDVTARREQMLDRLDKDRLTGPSKDGTTLEIAGPWNTDMSLKINSDKTERLERSGNSHITGGYICTRCGTLRSPEWRKGPHGPKTLCNACGLRWAKELTQKGQPIR